MNAGWYEALAYINIINVVNIPEEGPLPLDGDIIEREGVAHSDAGLTSGESSDGATKLLGKVHDLLLGRG
jgi:hypothetical protein